MNFSVLYCLKELSVLCCCLRLRSFLYESVLLRVSDCIAICLFCVMCGVVLCCLKNYWSVLCCLRTIGLFCAAEVD